MELFQKLGSIAIGTRVRFLSEKITEDASQIYELYNIQMNPKWFPVFYMLSQEPEKTITSIAEAIGHSHASVSKIVSEMLKAGLVVEKTSARDRRQTWISLSKAGKEVAVRIQDQYADVEAAIMDLSSQSRHDLWKALEEWEYLLSQKSLLDRVIEQKKKRQSSNVKIVSYQPKYRSAFQKLNLEWIKTHFEVEKADREALDDPEKSILSRGGSIFVALLEDRPVGVCALIRREDPQYPFELAKMAVAPEARGKNIGRLLGEAVIEKAKALKAERLFLESNTILKPAMGLYAKLGFRKVVGPPTPYKRCNIQMELKLKK